MLITQFQTLGRDLFNRGLVASQSGNLSVRMGEKILITRKHAMLNNLGERDLVETGTERNERGTSLASSELSIHRCIYRRTSALAVVHTHPPYTVALSLLFDEIVPQDKDGKKYLGRVPVISLEPANENARYLDDEISKSLCESPIVIIKGHGTYSTGQLLEEAYHRTMVLEESSHILCILKSLGVPLQIGQVAVK